MGAVVASGIPDVDVVFPLLGLSKRYHRNATHSLLFAALVTTTAFAATRMFELKPGTSVELAWIAALLSHLLLDVVTTGPTLGRLGWGIPLLWPFSTRRFHVRRPWFVGDRTESHTFRDTLREMREDALAIVPSCAVMILLVRFWPSL